MHWPTLVSVGLFPLIVFACVLLARTEARRMVEQFGEQYRGYSGGSRCSSRDRASAGNWLIVLHFQMRPSRVCGMDQVRRMIMTALLAAADAGVSARLNDLRT